MKNLNRLIYGLFCLSSMVGASSASAALSNVIPIPWEGDITKFHTAVAGQQIILKGVLKAANPTMSYTSHGTPTNVTFTMLDTDCSGGAYTYLINSSSVGTGGLNTTGCTCTPGTHTFTVTGSTLTTAWDLATPAVVEVQYSGGGYVAWVQVEVMWADGTDLTDCMYLVQGNACGSDNLCLNNGYSASSFDASINLGDITPAGPTSIQYQWNPGDGSAFTALTTVSVTPGTPTPVALNYTYAGSSGTPYVAWLIATDGTITISNRYLVQLQAAGLDANINIAIDDGLWFEYQQAIFAPTGHNGDINTMDGSPAAGWAVNGNFTGYWACSTASAIQAFEINGSLATGNFNQDPYAEVVSLGLNFLFKGYSSSTSDPVLQAVNIAPRNVDPWDNPDVSGDGIGIETFDDGGSRDPYQGGMIMDAIVASGTPNALTGRQFISGQNFTYKQVVQDMVDMYAWGESFEDYSASWVTYPSTLTSLPSGTPSSVAFNTFDLSCGLTGAYTFYINGQAVGTFPIGYFCSCAGGGYSLVVSGSALSTAWSLASPPTIGVSYSGGTQYGPSWVHASLTFGSDLYTICLTNFDTAGCDDTSSACNGYSVGAFSQSGDVSSYPVLSDDNVRQVNIIGAWHYYWQYPDPGDNSASQWAAIGQIAAQQAPFSCVVPNWVKTNENNYLNYSYTTDNGGTWGHFGYNSPGQFVQPDDHGDATTPSGLVQMILDGFTTSDPRWITAETWLAQNWDTGENWLANAAHNTLYPAYSVSKAMRLAQPDAIVDLSPTGFDWYRGSSSDTNGLAEIISGTLIQNGGHWFSAGGYGDSGNYWEGQTMGTAWAVIILKPNLFSAGPTACFSANPNPNFANALTYFDPTCSTDPQPGGIANLTKFDWNWGDGSPDTITTTPEVVTHKFACASLPCSYVVTLTVTDNSTPPLTSSDQQTINITEPPHPPVAVVGGPYIVSLCAGDTLTLNGSGSYTPDQGLKEANCNTCPPDHLTAYGWALKGAPYIYTDSTGTNDQLGTGFTAYFPTPGAYPIALQVTDDAALSFPGGADADLTDDAFGWVTNFAGGPCTVTIAGACDSVELTWNSTGATQYLVLASLVGPNTGFSVVASTSGALNASVAATLGQTVWYRVQGLSPGGITMSGAFEFANTFDTCICISPVTVQIKNLQIALSWSGVQGATGYNIYRSTAPGVALTPANRIAKGVGVPNDDYTDLTVVNGKTYYYRISVVVNGVETCRSEEVSGKAEALVR